ncbi:MAG: malto-oligosyltrehalose synthase [Deltaproteobacteria bacterium]|nr:malto-oligosyltrehalose synthase [Deltaproteobacteria bacterium]
MEKESPRSLKRTEEIFQATTEDFASSKRLPVSTYRLQFNHRFTFSQARKIVSYLQELGITDVYASPCFLARRGSLHGYDILDHNRLNPEIGTEEEYQEWVTELEKYGMGQIQDIVPNHMCITGDENNWWQDVLENGPGSLYADFFDIDWKPVKVDLNNKVLLPFLGDQYGRVLDAQEIVLIIKAGAFFISYGDQKLPLGPISYSRILKLDLEALSDKMGEGDPDLQELLSIITALDHLPPQSEKDPEKILERRREKEIIKKRISALYDGNKSIQNFIDQNINTYNGQKGISTSFELLDGLLNAQAYRFSHWRVATDEINYRRFFDINELAGLRVERPQVFLETHRLIFKLVREKKVTGLRVDHPDGLYNPSEYFYRLQKACFIQKGLHRAEERLTEADQASISLEDFGKELGRLYDAQVHKDPAFSSNASFYIIGEKILTRNERMPEDWPIFGSVGYDFLNPVNGILIDSENAKAFDALYGRFISRSMNYTELVYEKKKLIMQVAMSAEINMLGHTLDRLAEKNRYTRDFTLNSLKTAIMEVIACFPVYRSYVNYCQVLERDRHYIEQAVAGARRKNPALSALIFAFLEKILLFRYPEEFGEAEKMEWLDFVMRFQQFTGPVMAKGLEDTVFYIYNRLLSLNDVGGNPEDFGTSLEAFHGRNIEKTKSWTHSLNATSTHDTKRSEDVRARINVLSELPDEWGKCLVRWGRINKKKKSLIDDQRVPDPNEEYFLYQTLLGAWPLPPQNKSALPFIEKVASTLLKTFPSHPADETDRDIFVRRIKEYMVKAVREAKIHSSWINPDLAYEEALLQFIEALLSPPTNNAFLKDFKPFQEKLAYWGMFNSLSQTLLKIVSPGTPDFYQGTELWDFSLADPDNRRPVDFKIRQDLLKKLKKKVEAARKDLTGLAEELIRDWKDGRIKLYVTFRALNYRRENHLLFAEGIYLPLTAEGKRNRNICAFARQKEDKTALIIVPRLLAGQGLSPEIPPLGKVWEDSQLFIPDEIAGDHFYNIFTGETAQVVEREGRRTLPLEVVFAFFPLALLTSS